MEHKVALNGVHAGLIAIRSTQSKLCEKEGATENLDILQYNWKKSRAEDMVTQNAEVEGVGGCHVEVLEGPTVIVERENCSMF